MKTQTRTTNHKIKMLLAGCISLLCGPAIIQLVAQTPLQIAQQAYLKASNTAGGIGVDTGDQFGQAVAVWGDTVVVGADSEDSNATGVNGNQNNNSATNSGAAYVFVRSGTNWIQQAYLKASNTDSKDTFGYSVALSGDTIVIGAVREASSATGVNGNQSDNSAGTDAGAAYVFVRSGTNWTQQAYLKASNTDAGDWFGASVAISGDTVAIAAPFESSNATGVNGNQSDNSASGAGAAYVFVRNGTNWIQQAYLKASNAEGGTNALNPFGDFFGASVAVSGDTIVVGALEESSNATGVNGNQSNNNATNSGAAYVFVRNGTNWTQQAYLKASNTGANDRFGASVAISDDTVVVGAVEEASNATGVNGNQSNNSAPGAGAAYVFVRSGTNWTQQAYLKASNTGGGASFGSMVAVSGDTVAIAAPHESSNARGINGNQNNNNAFVSGAVYLFVRNGTNWSQQAYLKASNTDEQDVFGGQDIANGMALSGNTVVVGAPGEASNAIGVNGNQSNNSAYRSGAAYVFTGVGPQAPPELRLTAARVGDQLQLTATGTTNTQWRIEFRDTVTGTNAWQPLTNISLGLSPFIFEEPLGPTNRFYRGAWLP